MKSITPQPIRYVVSTHNHNDHTGGNPLFAASAELIAHRNARDNMIRGKQAAPPRIVFNDEASVFLGGAEVRMVHLGRGHTNGDAVVYFPELKVVHTGDLVVWGKRTDGTILTPFSDSDNGGSIIEWTATLDKLLEIDFDTAIPGHGPVLTKDDVRTFRAKVATLKQRLDDLVQARVAKDRCWREAEDRRSELAVSEGAARHDVRRIHRRAAVRVTPMHRSARSFCQAVLAVAVVAVCSASCQSVASAPPQPSTPAAAPAPARDTHEQLQGVLWIETAGEYRGAARSIYAGARGAIDRGLSDREWTAAIEQTGNFGRLPRGSNPGSR